MVYACENKTCMTSYVRAHIFRASDGHGEFVRAITPKNRECTVSTAKCEESINKRLVSITNKILSISHII